MYTFSMTRPTCPGCDYALDDNDNSLVVGGMSASLARKAVAGLWGVEAWTVEGYAPLNSNTSCPSIRCRACGLDLADQVTHARVGDPPPSPERLVALERLYQLVRQALSQKGGDACWKDLYNPEVAALVGVEFDPALLPREAFMKNCARYYDCLAERKPYEAPPAEAT